MAPPPGVPTRPRTVSFARDLAAFGDQVAVVGGGVHLTYAELAARVQAFADHLGTSRRLVLVTGANTVDTLVAYLGALAGDHPVVLAPAGNEDAIGSVIAT